MDDPIRMIITAQQAHHRARPGRAVIGWKLDPGDRASLLERFSPRYERIVADHVTLKPRVHPGSPLPVEEEGCIVGRVDDGQGVQALVVDISGTTRRPDGGTYHVTWSLAEGRKPKESNDVLAAHAWEPVEPPVPVKLRAAIFQ